MTLWLDQFPVTNWRDRPDLQQEVRVQVCETETSVFISVERRLFREYFEGGQLKQEQVAEWTPATGTDGGRATQWIMRPRP